MVGLIGQHTAFGSYIETVEEKQLNKKDVYVGKRTHDVEIDEAQVTEPIAGDNNLVSIPEPEKEAEVK